MSPATPGPPAGPLQAIAVDAAAIDRLLEDARRHLTTTRAALAVPDLAGAYQLAYDAARKACTALLAAQGWRVRGPGAHATLIAWVQQEYGATPGAPALAQLDRMRQTRNAAEYRGYPVAPAEVADDLATAAAIVAWAARLLAARPG